MPATCDLTEPLCHMTTWTWDYLNTNFANILKSCKFESVVNEKVLIIWSLWTFFSSASRFGIFCTDCDTVLLLGARWLLFLWDCYWERLFSIAVFPLKTYLLSVLHLDLEPESHRGDETHRGTEEVVGEVTLVQRQFMVQHRLRHRRDRVKTQTQNTSATTSAVCVCVCAHADVCISTVREGVSSSQFLVVIFNQCCGGWMRKCLSGFVSCFRHTNHLFLPLFSSYLCERIRQKGREEINCILK